MPQSEMNGVRPQLSVVVPLYNEQENLPELYRRLTAALDELASPYEILLVDDGSQDETPTLLDALHERDPGVIVIHLARNFGHQAAICAGLDHARGAAVAILDGDLQDPPELLPGFMQFWRDGYDVVYAVRQKRQEGPFRRLAYFAFYRLLRAISDLDIPLDSGDFCLMDRKVVEALKALPERVRFVRGLRTFVGFRQIGVCYDRAARHAGKPKYTFAALVGLASDGLVSFSSYPLRLITYFGLVSIALALAFFVFIVFDAIYNRTAPRGWASIVTTVLFMGSAQLLSLGVMGEYVRRIFLESKGRPTYIVRNIRADAAGASEAPPDGMVRPHRAATRRETTQPGVRDSIQEETART